MLCIDAPHFSAAVIPGDRAAPIIKYMRTWSIEKIKNYCHHKGWHCYEYPMTEKVSAFDAYQINLSLRLHFAGSYDAIKYNFKVNRRTAVPEMFKNKPEAYWYAKLAERYSRQELINFFVANYIGGDKYGGIFNTKKAEEVYLEWKKRIDSQTYYFRQDIIALHEFVASKVNPDPVLLADLVGLWREDYPNIFTAYLTRKVHLDTVCLVEKMTRFTVKSADAVSHVFWPKFCTEVRKYEPFLKYDPKAYRAILLEHFPVGG